MTQKKTLFSWQLAKLKQDGTSMVDKMSAISKDIEERKSKLKVAQEIKNVLERQRQVSKAKLGVIQIMRDIF